MLVVPLAVLFAPITLASLLLRDGRAFWERASSAGAWSDGGAPGAPSSAPGELALRREEDGEVDEVRTGPTLVLLVVTAPRGAWTRRQTGRAGTRWIEAPEARTGSVPEGGPDPMLLAGLLRTYVREGHGPAPRTGGQERRR
jgi:hypothetical protein